MAGALVAISALPASTTILSTDIVPFVKSGTTDKITAGNLRTQMFAFAANDPLNCGVLTAVGNSTITGTLSGITTFTASSIVGNVTGNLTGTVLTAAQPSITSLGTLVSLTVTGTVSANAHVSGTTQLINGLVQTTGSTDLNFGTVSAVRWYMGGAGNVGFLLCATDNAYDIGASGAARPRNMYIAGTGTFGGNMNFGGSVTMTPAASQLIPGATSFSHRNNANNADNLLISDAGVATVRAGVIVTTGNMALTAGSLTFGAAASKIIPGATSLSLRNNADSADNLILTDAGVATVRAGVTVTAGNLALTAGNLTFGATSGKIIPGATSLLFRNNADTQTNLLILDSGAASFRSGLTVQGGSILLTGATTTFSSLNMPSGTAPTSPADGDMWYDGTNVKFRVGVTTKTFTLT